MTTNDSGHRNIRWTPDLLAQLDGLLKEGLSHRQAAARMGTTRDAVNNAVLRHLAQREYFTQLGRPRKPRVVKEEVVTLRRFDEMTKHEQVWMKGLLNG